MNGWLEGYGVEPGRAAPQPQAARPIQCPKCKSDYLKVRSSDRGTSFLQCLSCGHGDGSTVWKVTLRLKRVLIIIDG